MPDAVRQYLRLTFPAGMLLLLLAAAAVFYGADIPAAKAMFSAAIMGLAGVTVIASRRFFVPASAWAGLTLLLLFAAQHVWMGRMDTAAPEFAALASAGAVWLIARDTTIRLDAGARLWQASLAVGAVIAVWAFFDFTLGPRTAAHMRLSGGFLSPNTAATFFGIIALMGLAELIRQIRRAAGSVASVTGKAPALALASASFLIPATCLVLTASRGGIAFAALSGLALAGWQVLVATRRGHVERRSLGLGIAALAVLISISGLVWTVSGELASARFGQGVTGGARADMFAAYWEAVPLAPVSGHGLGSFPFTNDLIATSLNTASLSRSNAAHNVFLQWLLQAGWAGALVMWAVAAFLIWEVFAGLARRRRQLGYLRAVICISGFAVLHGLTDFALEIPGVMWWWAWLLGIGAGIASGGSRAGQRSAVAGAAVASRPAFGIVVLVLAGWMAWQGQMRVAANQALEMPRDAFIVVMTQDQLPPSAFMLDAYGDRAIAADIADLDFAERMSLAALEREPRLVTAWNRLVFVDLARNGRLTEAGQAALSQSFHLSPYGDRRVMRWRIQIASAAWQDLDDFNRRQVRSQLQALAVSDRGWLRTLVREASGDFREEAEAALGL